MKQMSLNMESLMSNVVGGTRGRGGEIVHYLGWAVGGPSAARAEGPSVGSWVFGWGEVHQPKKDFLSI